MSDRLISRSEYQMVTKDENGEPQIHNLESKRYVVSDDDIYPPATPARITPSRRKAKTTKNKKDIFVFSDAQIGYRRDNESNLIPTHNELAMSVARLICRDIQPDYIVNCGDTIDLSELGSFAPDSNHYQRTLGPSFQRVHDYYAELRADNPNAEIIEVDSNHNTRLKKFVLKYMPDLYNVKRAGASDDDFSILTYPYLANLNHLDVKWSGGYGADEYVYGEQYGTPPIVFRHGRETSSNGTTASKIMKVNPETHVVQGHDHTPQYAMRRNRAGRYLQYHVVGTLCSIDGEVPSYNSAVNDRNEVVKHQENWANSVMHIEDYNGEYTFNHITINNGQAHYRDKTYNVSERLW